MRLRRRDWLRCSGCSWGSLAEAGDGVEVALAEADLPLVGAPLPGEASVQGPQVVETPAARFRLGPGAADARSDAKPGKCGKYCVYLSDR